MKPLLRWLAKEWREFWRPPKHDFGLRNPTPLYIKDRTMRRVQAKFVLFGIPLALAIALLLIWINERFR